MCCSKQAKQTIVGSHKLFLAHIVLFSKIKEGYCLFMLSKLCVEVKLFKNLIVLFEFVKIIYSKCPLLIIIIKNY